MSESLSDNLENARVRHDFSKRAEYVRAALELESIDREVIAINDELSSNPDLRISAHTSFSSPTPVYSYDLENDEIRMINNINAEGRSFVFFGDRLMIGDDHVIVANSKTGFGIPFFGFDAGNIMNTNEINGFQRAEHEYLTERFRQIKPDEYHS